MILRNGNIIYLLLFSFVFSWGQEINLAVRSTQGDFLKQITQGEPFVVEATVESDLNDFVKPELKMPNECQSRQTGIKMMSNRGRSITTYIYTARIDKRGTYTIGPAKINQYGTAIQSNECVLAVADTTVLETGKKSGTVPVHKKKQSSADQVLARLSLNKDSAVVGEKLKAHLRFYKIDPTIDLQSIIEPNYQAQGWQIKNRTGPVQSQEEVDGTLYDYLEWQWELYPTKTGELTLPAYRIDYTVRSEREDIFSFILGTRISKTLYSNAVTVAINSLPPHSKQVNAIGSFHSFTATIHPSMVHEGEGMTMLIQLQGDTDIETLHFELSDLPDSVKSYPSQKYTKDGSIYCIEYILQARKHGEYEVPAQSFTYFDVDKRKYVTLHTNAIPFTVIASAVNQSSKKDEIKTSSDQVYNEDGLRPINRDIWYPIHERIISWLLYIYLILVPLLFLLLVTCVRGLFNYLKTKIAFRQWLSCIRAKKLLNEAKKNQDITQLHTIFMQFFSETLDNKNLDEHEISSWIHNKISSERMQQWRTFFCAIEQVRYCNTEAMDTKELFNQAYQWLAIINNKQNSKKKIAATILIVLLPAMHLFASDQERFLQANVLYDAGQWAQAFSMYDKIKNKGGTVWYNMGHCCYNQQDFLRAYYYWKKASLYSFNKDYNNAQFNKSKAAAKLGINEHISWLSAVEKRLLTVCMQIIFLFFWYILLWYAAVLFRRRKMLLLTVLVCATVVSGSLVGIKYKKSFVTEGIIAQDTECFSGPHDNYQVIATIGKATCVKIVGQQEEWIKIQTKTDRGWIKKEAVLIL